MLEPSGVAYINGYGPERAGVGKEATGITAKIVQSILGFISFLDSTIVVSFPHCLLANGKAHWAAGIKLSYVKLRHAFCGGTVVPDDLVIALCIFGATDHATKTDRFLCEGNREITGTVCTIMGWQVYPLSTPL